MAWMLCPPDCMVASIAVMNSNSTVNAHGLIPSTAAATMTVGRVIFGKYICMASIGALGCHRPVRAMALNATTANVESVRMRRSGDVAIMLALDNDLAIHSGIGTPSTTNITVKSIRTGLVGCEGDRVGTFGLGNN